MTVSPRVFMSYSHDSDAHKGWVLALATRLVKNGVDAILDQWDLTLGSDIARFMEQGLTGADRVVAVCSQSYVRKGNEGVGGAGYEKAILTGEMMTNLTSDRIVPVIRHNAGPALLPTFLSSRLYIDFRDDDVYEQRYAELLRDIYGEKIQPRPPLGQNPFLRTVEPVTPSVSFTPERYVSPTPHGTVTFDFSNNNGRFVVGAGDMQFETIWGEGSNDSINVYNDASSIRTVAIARGVSLISDIGDASLYDTTSRVRRPFVGEIVVWQNTAGYYLATLVEKAVGRSHGAPEDEVRFSYVIAPNKSKSFQA